jgi:hypothetical protein
MKIKIRPTTGQKEIIEIEISDSATNTINDLKTKITEVWTDISISRLKLIFAGQMLKNEDLITKYKIQDGCTIHCLITCEEQTQPVIQHPAPNTNPLPNLFNEVAPSQQSNIFGSNLPPMTPEMLEMIQQMMQNPQAMQMAQQMMQNPEMMQMINQMAQSDNNIDSTNTENDYSEESNTNDEELYQDQLSQLSNLGFTNTVLNIQLLKSCNGNVDTAANLLFDQN